MICKNIFIPFLIFSGISFVFGGETIIRTIKTSDSEIKVFIDGTNTDNVILMLHGGPGVPDYLAAVAENLKGKFMIVRFDQRGSGGSKAISNDYSLENLTNDIDAVMAELGIYKFHLFGHSWGGLLAEIYASGHKNRIKSMFLLSPSSGTGSEWLEMEKEVFDYNMKKADLGETVLTFINFPLAMAGSDSAYRYIYGNIWRWYFKNPKEAPPADSSWLKGIHAAAVNGITQSIVNMTASKLDGSFIDLTFPVLIAYGQYDIYGKSREYTFKRFKTARNVIFENAGHLPWIQDKETFFKLLNDFYSIIK